MPGTAAGTCRRKDMEGGGRDLGHRRLLGALCPRDDHVGLQEHPLERHSLRVQRTKDDFQDRCS